MAPLRSLLDNGRSCVVEKEATTDECGPKSKDAICMQISEQHTRSCSCRKAPPLFSTSSCWRSSATKVTKEAHLLAISRASFCRAAEPGACKQNQRLRLMRTVHYPSLYPPPPPKHTHTRTLPIGHVNSNVMPLSRPLCHGRALSPGRKFSN